MNKLFSRPLLSIVFSETRTAFARPHGKPTSLSPIFDIISQTNYSTMAGSEVDKLKEFEKYSVCDVNYSIFIS